MEDPFASFGIQPPVDNAAPPATPYQQPAPPYQQPPQQQQPAPQYQQPPQQYYQQPAQPAYEAQPPAPPQQQLVVAAQPSNPYAGMVAPQPTQQQSTPWDAPPSNPNSSFVAPPPTRSSTASASSFDPFAAIPAQAPPPQQQQQQPAYSAPSPAAQDPWSAAPAPQPAPAAQDPWSPAHAPQPAPAAQDPWSPAHAPQPAPAAQDPWSAAPAPPPQPAPAAQDPWSAAPSPAAPRQQSYSQQPYQTQDRTQKSAYSGQSYGNINSMKSSDNGSRQMVPAPSSSIVARGNDARSKNEDGERYKKQNPRNPYSTALAQQVAGSNTSGLPKAELVGKRGFVLSRISFRTIVMKKWKQSFWVQYGGHTMLWFRSQSDFDDWLNNPYHNQSQRNFLIKLAINFVHDLYKPNVRGYQVTQCRTKPYGNNKVVRQFKLERWMDYGPTIAAAFGSYDPKEVDACREAIVECMKNTPLDNGIRATGAVKEHHDRKQEEEWRRSQEERRLGQKQNGATGSGYQNYSLGAGQTNHTEKDAGRQRTPSFDLLGDMSGGGGIDDSASVPPSFFGDRALVPAVNPNAAYPGAPPPPQAASYYPSAQPQAYPGQQPQASIAPSPFAAPAGYPGQPQQAPAPAFAQQQQAPAPAFAQQQAPAPAFAHQQQQAPAPAFAQQPQAGYSQQQQQHGAYPGSSYPVPTQQY